MFKWIPGRQNTGIYKWQFIALPFADGYILKYPQGSYLDWHTDAHPDNKKHFRINIVLRKSLGGEFEYRGKLIFKLGRTVVLFRPDIVEHRVTTIKRNTRLVLSIGWTAGLIT